MADESKKDSGLDSPASDTDELREVHTLAVKRHDEAYAVGQDQMDKSIEDTRFSQVEGAQWDDLAKRRRKNRPRYEINKVQLMVNKVVGDALQNRVSPKTRPAGRDANRKTAKVYNGIIRNIENQSNFKGVAKVALKEAVTGGMGAWQEITVVPDDDVFDQEIRRKAIPSAVTRVFFDPSATDLQKRDAQYCFVDEWIGIDEFEKKWPDKTASSISAPARGFFHRVKNWFRKDRVRISDYWLKEPITKKIAQLSDGRVVEVTKDFDKVRDELLAEGVTVARSAQGNEMVVERQSHKVVHYKISGADVLSGPNEWAGKHIPIVPLFGYSMHIGEDHYYRGLTRFAKDPQRVLNYSVSGAIESTALAPKDPIWMTPTQIGKNGAELAAMNVTNKPIMKYNHDPQEPGPPKRTGAPALNSAQIQQVSMMDGFIETTTGLFAPSLGDNPASQSGKALLAQQAQGDSATFELMDNYTDAVQYAGEIDIDLIPHIIDNERQIQIIQPDGESEMVMVNQTVEDGQTGDFVNVVDLRQGKYDFTVDVGPSYRTQRTEAVNALTELSRNNPAFAQVSGDLIAKNLNFSESEELTSRMRKIGAANGYVDLSEEEIQEDQEKQASQGPQKPDPIQMMQMEQMKQQMEEQALKNDRLELENAKLQLDIQQDQKTQMEEAAEEEQAIVNVEKTEAEVAKLKSETLKNEQDAVSTRNDRQNQ